MESLPPVLVKIIGLISVVYLLASLIYDPTGALAEQAKWLNTIYTVLSALR